MKQKILKLTKRLNKFDFDEIECISQCETNELKEILNALIKENQIKLVGNLYIYSSEKQTKKKVLMLPKKFQYHPKETIDMIIKCFCADISVIQTIKILNPQKNCLNKFHKFFREVIYKLQEDELLEYFEKKPKLSCRRTFFGKNVYLYFYNDKLFVSNKNLSNNYAAKHEKEEIKKLKKTYCFIKNHLNSHVYKTMIHLHVSEQIWCYGKEFEKLKDELYSFLFQ